MKNLNNMYSDICSVNRNCLQKKFNTHWVYKLKNIKISNLKIVVRFEYNSFFSFAKWMISNIIYIIIEANSQHWWETSKHLPLKLYRLVAISALDSQILCVYTP